MSADAVAWHSQIATDFDNAYRRSAMFRERQELWGRLIRAWLVEGGRVLDAGCGSGVLSFEAAQAGGAVTGFDASPDMVALAQAKSTQGLPHAPQFRVARLEGIAAFGEGDFDLVLSSSVLEYVNDLDAALQGLARALKPGGVLLVSLPNGGSAYRLFERAIFMLTGRPKYRAFVRNVPTPASFAAHLSAAGLENLYRETFAAAPGIGKAMRALGLGSATDTMCVFAARRRD